MKKLNVGSGIRRLPGYINADFNKNLKPDVVWDITKKAPFNNGEIDEILCDNVLEHLDDFIPTIKEFYRILKRGGKLIIIVPHFTSVFWDIPSHKRPFSYFTFHHFSEEYKLNKETEDVGAYFRRVKTSLIFAKKFAVWNYLIEAFANWFPLIYEQTFIKSLFPCWLIRIELWK